MKKKKNVLLSLNKKKVSELSSSFQQQILGGSNGPRCESGSYVNSCYGCGGGGSNNGCGGGGGTYTNSPGCTGTNITC